MQIYIKTGEAGWETERRIEVPDNEKLLGALLRCVKRHTALPAENGGGGYLKTV